MQQRVLDKILSIPGWLSKNEGLLLCELAQKEANRGAIVEIGSFMGKSTIFLALGVKEKGRGRVYAIDPHLGITHAGKREHRETFTNFRKHLEKFGVTKFVEPIRKGSEEANKKWGGKISLLFVDGLHEYKFAKKDLRIWLPLLKEDGVVVCHDAFGPYPDVFWAVKEEIFSRGFKDIGVLDSMIFAVKGNPKTVIEWLNGMRMKYFLNLAMSVWQLRLVPYWLRFLIVNRLLKLGFINQYMLRVIWSKIKP